MTFKVPSSLDPIRALSKQLEKAQPEFFNSLSPRARVTCERIADQAKLNWLDKLGVKVLPTILERKWSLSVLAYKITLFFHSIIYRNQNALSGDDLVNKFKPVQSFNKPEINKDDFVRDREPVVAQESSSEVLEEKVSSSEENKDPVQIAQESSSEVVEEEVLRAEEEKPVQIAQLRTAVSASPIETVGAVLNTIIEEVTADKSVIQSIAESLQSEEDSNDSDDAVVFLATDNTVSDAEIASL
jgi:hypothetical protein